MSEIVTITDVFKVWHARKDADNLFNLNFTQNGSALDITDYTFSGYIRNVGEETNLVTLTEGGGFTNNGATGVVNGSLTIARLLPLLPNTYFLFIKVVDPDGNTFGVINSAFQLHGELYAGDITEDVAITVNLAGTEINIAVTFPGGSSGGSGTVTSVSSGNLSPLFTAAVAAPTTTPALSFAQITKAANLVFSGPASGADANPDFRALVALDIPISGPGRTLYINNSSSGLTGGTGETKVASVLIPGGTIGANDIIEIVNIGTKVGANGIFTYRHYFNTSDAIGGVQTSVTGTSASANLWNSFIRRGVCKNSVSAQIWYNLSNASDDMATTNSAKLSTSVNFAINQYFVVSAQNSSAADTSTLEGVVLKIFRQ